MRFLLFFLVLASINVGDPGVAYSEPRFKGSFVFEWTNEPLNSHRNMKLISDVQFIDNDNKVWAVPSGTVVDGATIPSFLWSFSGSPFVGNYRRASVIHDFFCDTEESGADKIHRMFREAMIADGVDWIEAAAKHTAVVIYGETVGKCGKPKPPIQSLSSWLEFSQQNSLVSGFSNTNALTQRLQNLDDIRTKPYYQGLSSENVKIFADNAADFSDSKYPEMLDAMINHAINPSTETFKTMETKIIESGATIDEIEAHALLTNAAVPR